MLIIDKEVTFDHQTVSQDWYEDKQIKGLDAVEKLTEGDGKADPPPSTIRELLVPKILLKIRRILQPNYRKSCAYWHYWGTGVA